LVDADKARITQVISNLVNNAIKFTKRGKISITTEVRADNQAIVSVQDTGTGINDDIMPRLFTKFATKSQTGTGLGLFISKSIIEAHGGKIWAENNDDGKGATFTFTLPLTV
jgi:signal transduction histidine kinase